MKVEIKEVAVVTKDNGEEVIVWDTGFIDTIRSLGVILPPVPNAVKRANRAHKPKPESQIRINADRSKHSAYGTRPCASCGQMFSPRSGRAKVCDACCESGALRRKKAQNEPSTALSEIRKLAAANLGPYNPERSDDAS